MIHNPLRPNPEDENAKAWEANGEAAADSIRAPLGNKAAGIEWVPVPITELGEYTPPPWVWPGYVARGHSTLFTGLWKAGKSTLLAHLLRDIGRGGGLVSDPMTMDVLVASEESPSIWRRRREDLALSESVRLLCRPFKARADWPSWYRFVDRLAELVRTEGYGMVIIDTLPSVWPVQNENDASEVGSALMPMHLITEAGAGLLLVHHPRKGGGDQGQAARGSGALPGFVDVIVELRRHTPDDAADRRRVLTTFSRFDESPAESVIELGPNGYNVIGDRAHVVRTDRLDLIAATLPPSHPGLTVDEVLEKWAEHPKPGKRTLQDDLGVGVTAGKWHRTGTGVKGDPFRFWGDIFDSGKPRP